MSPAALGACARIAWRQAKRAPGRAALVIAMIAFPVAALSGGATLIHTSVPTIEEHIAGVMGSAELIFNPPLEIDRAALESELDPRARLVSMTQWNHSMIFDGALLFVTAYEPSVRIDQPPLLGLFELREGRVPSAPGEAAVDPRVLEVFGVEIGSDLTLGDRSFRVVGVAARSDYTFDTVLVVAPGTLSPSVPGEAVYIEDEPFLNNYLVDLPPGADVGQAQNSIRAHLLRAAERSDDPSLVEQLRNLSGEEDLVRTREQVVLVENNAAALTGASFGGTALALFATGLIAAAAFAVGIRRQLHVLGLVGATGGDMRQIRAVVLLGGTTLGMAGAAVGITLGVGAAYGITPHLHRFTHRLPGAVDLPVPTILGAGLLGVVAATVAAMWPARVGARISTLDALASRMPTPRPPGRMARGGLVVVVVGALLTGVLFTPGDDEVVLTAGLGLMLIGFLISIPWLVTMAGRFAPRLPTASRLAIRDTARHGRRTGTAIAAAALALTTPVAVTAVTLSEDAYQRRNRLIGEEHILIGNQLSDLSGRPRELPDGVQAEIARAIPGATVVEIRGAMLDLKRHPPAPSEKPIAGGGITEYPAWAEGPEIPLEAAGEETVVKVTDDGAESTITTPSSYRRFGQVMIGDAEMLRALHAEDGIPALEAGKIVGIGPGTTENGFVSVLLFSYEGESPRLQVPAVEAGTTSYSGDFVPLYVVSERGAEAIGLLPGPPAYHNALVAAPDPLTGEDIRAVRDVVARYEGAFVQTLDDFLPNHTVLRLAATAGAMVVALAIVAVVLALIGAEARRDQAILSAIGAGSGARRRIAASRGGLVALLAAAVAVPAGFVPVAVVQWSRPEEFPILVPWATIALVLVAVPAVAAGFSWLTSRKPSSSAMLQPIA